MSNNKKVLLVSDGEKVSAIPVEVFDQHELTGSKLSAANTVLAESSGDVEGQSNNVNAEWYCENASGTCDANGNFIDSPYRPWTGKRGTISK